MAHRCSYLIILLTALALASCSSRPPAADSIERPPPASATDVDWPHYLGDPHSSQYSRLDQIVRENVDRLEVAWTYVTGDSAEYQSNNLIVDGVLYTATPTRRVTALDAETGEHLWTFDPDDVNQYEGNKYQGGGRQRGVMYWEDGKIGASSPSKGRGSSHSMRRLASPSRHSAMGDGYTSATRWTSRGARMSA